jgi:uncharacterized membrane protein/glutaredoxin
LINVTLYTRKGCHLCEQAKADLEALQAAIPHKLVEVDIESEADLVASYALEIPVVEIGPYRLKAPFTPQELQVTLRAAADRKSHLEKLEDKPYQAAAARGQKVTGSDRFSYWMSRHYMLVFNLFLLLYIGVPFLAPVFKQVGWNGPATAIYKAYSPLCHQWAFRSFFLFGEQAYYPHAEANIPGVITLEAATGISDQTDPSRLQARAYEGDSVLGFKVALCERDVAIWGAMLLFGLLFAISGRRIPKLHWMVWLIVGLVPVGLDGFSQLFSQLPPPYDFLHAILPYRESTPFLRSLTGFLFGAMTAWFMFPLIEETMADTRRVLAKKFAVIGRSHL